MADVSQQRLGAPQGSVVTAKQGVQEAPSNTVGLLGALVKGGSAFLTNSQNKQDLAAKEEKAAKVEANTSAFARKQISIAQAVARGDIDSATGRARMRANFSQELAAGGTPYAELSKVQKDIIGTAGLGKIVAEGTEAEQLANAQNKEAKLNGWDNTQDYLQFKQAQDKLAQAQSQQTFESGAIDLAKKKETRTQQVALGEMNSAYTRKFRTDIDKIVADVTSGAMSPEDGVYLMDQQWNTVNSLIASMGDQAGAAYLTNMTAPMKSIYELSRKRASGEISEEIFKRQNTLNIEKAKLNITGNPKHAQTIAVSQMLNNSDLLIQKQINDIVLDMTGKNSGTNGSKPADLTDPETSADAADYFRINLDSVKAINNGTALDVDASRQEVLTNLANVIKGVSSYAASVENPSDYNQVVTYLADPATGKLIQAEGGIPSDSLEDAKAIFETEYKQDAIQAVLREFESGKLSTSGSQFLGTQGQSGAVSANILPVFSGTGVVFVNTATKGSITDTRQSLNSAARLRTKELNKKVAPVINRLIRLDAHLSGGTDYAKVYRDNYESLFTPEQEPATQATPKREPTELPPEVPSRLPEEMVAKIRQLKESGVTKDQISNVLTALDLNRDSGTGSFTLRAIEEVFGSNS